MSMKKGPRGDLFSLVGVRGLEPRTSSLSGMRSNRLSYTPSFRKELYRISEGRANRPPRSEGAGTPMYWGCCSFYFTPVPECSGQVWGRPDRWADPECLIRLRTV